MNREKVERVACILGEQNRLRSMHDVWAKNVRAGIEFGDHSYMSIENEVFDIFKKAAIDYITNKLIALDEELKSL